MASHRRTSFGAELMIQFIGIGFMMLIMFQVLPGAGGGNAVPVFESPAVTVVANFAVLFVAFAGVTLFVRSRRPRTPIERGNSTIFHAHIAPPPTTVTANISSQLRKIDWFQVEKLVALTYRKLGYNVEHCGGQNAHGGFDLIIQKVGQRTAVHCKHWKNWNVGVKRVREFVGALKASGIEKGIFVTLNGYTGDAKQLADKHDIEIINQLTLTRMLESTNAHFDPEVKQLLSKNHRCNLSEGG